jgi:hypothetical protein
MNWARDRGEPQPFAGVELKYIEYQEKLLEHVKPAKAGRGKKGGIREAARQASDRAAQDQIGRHLAAGRRRKDGARRRDDRADDLGAGRLAAGESQASSSAASVAAGGVLISGLPAAASFALRLSIFACSAAGRTK